MSAYRAALRRRDLRLLFGEPADLCDRQLGLQRRAAGLRLRQTPRWAGSARRASGASCRRSLSAYGGVIAERFERVRVMVAPTCSAWGCRRPWRPSPSRDGRVGAWRSSCRA